MLRLRRGIGARSRRSTRVLSLLGAFCLGAATVAAAGELRILCPSALRAPMLESARGFARASGHRLEFTFAAVAAVHKRVATGERADIAIGSAQGAHALVGLKRGVEGSVVPLVASALALVLPKHAGALDVGDPAALAHRLRDAQSLVVPDPALGVPGGAQAAELLQRLGLAETLRDRIRYVADAREISKRVASGAAAAGLGAMSELVAASDVSVLGPILEPRTEGIVYAALLVHPAWNAATARAFLAHLRAPESQALFRKAGFVPIE